MSNLITYRGGSNGDFLRVLLFLGNDSIEEIHLEGEYISAKIKNFGMYEKFTCVTSTGKVDKFRPLSYNDDFTRGWFDDIRFMTKNKAYFETFLTKIKSHQEKLDVGLNFKIPLDFCATHDYYVFYETFSDLTEFYRMVDALGYKRIIFISLTTRRSNKLRHVNSLIKNHGYDLNKALSEYTIDTGTWFYKEYECMLQNKRPHDIIIELEDIYNKEKLRNILSSNFNEWSDKYFDTFYDFYMGKQLYIGD